MLELQGKHNTAKVFATNAEQSAISQIINLLNQKFAAGSKIRIMPDMHAGVGCTIGTTMTIADKVVPNLVGVDIGCGMQAAKLRNGFLELEKLDNTIKRLVPAGPKTRKAPHDFASEAGIKDLVCKKSVNLNRAELSIGTLGGGNHFIEANQAENGDLYLVVHSGSRHLGKQVAEHYQREAYLDMQKKGYAPSQEAGGQKGRQREAQSENAGSNEEKFDKSLAYCEGALFDDYIHDMQIAQHYASLNREAIIDVIAREMKLKIDEQFTTIHNYIDIEEMILRKGAISAKAGEKVIIPMNMRDGSLIAIGKGNPDWNYSAPHGAGRLMSRSQAKQSFTLKEFQESMSGIYSSTVNKSTIDEAPFAYKPMHEITSNIGDTVDIMMVIMPIYNFKSAE